MSDAKQIERVAAAIFRRVYAYDYWGERIIAAKQHPQWRAQIDGRKNAFRGLARAAIKAMKPRSKKP